MYCTATGVHGQGTEMEKPRKERYNLYIFTE